MENLQRIKHPNICQLHDVYDTTNYLHLVMELCDGGMLFTDIAKRHHYFESDAATAAKALFEAVKYLHNQGVAHRDIKPQNILLDKHGTMKLADFGFSKVFGTSSGAEMLMRTQCGTPDYVAPEVWGEPNDVRYSKQVDIWSLGACRCHRRGALWRLTFEVAMGAPRVARPGPGVH